MQKAHLRIRRARAGAVENYQESAAGPVAFTWSSFAQDQKYHLALQPMEASEAPPFYYQNEPPHSLPKEQYMKALENTIATIQKQGWGKVVLSRAQFVPQPQNPKQLFKKLCQAYPQLTVYLFSHPKVGTWCGATPETLLEKEGTSLKTMSLAGTRKVGSTQDFSAKEYHEQRLVTEFIEQTLQASPGISTVEKGEVEEVQAAQVLHLQTKLQAQINDSFAMQDLLEKLHPTPAVSGLPRQEALEYIQQTEGYSRGFYAGYFGLSQQQAAHYWVNLRCMQLFKNGFSLYAGGGITAQSHALSEWHETEAKMETLLSVVNR